MTFGQIGNIGAYAASVRTPKGTQKLQADHKRASEIVDEFRAVAADTVSLNKSNSDVDPASEKIAVNRNEVTQRVRIPGVEDNWSTGFKAARILFPPLMLLFPKTGGTGIQSVRSGLSAVAQLDENQTPTSLEAEVSRTGAPLKSYSYQVEEDGTQTYSVKTYRSAEVADVWERDKPLGLHKHISVPMTETVKLKDGEFSYQSKDPRIGSRTTYLELVEEGYTV